MGKVQISDELFWRLCGFFLLDHREPIQETIIKNELQAKCDAMKRHDDYLKSKEQGQ